MNIQISSIFLTQTRVTKVHTFVTERDTVCVHIHTCINILLNSFLSLTGGELQASIPSSTQNESVCKVSGIGGKHIIQRRLKSRRRTSQLCVSFPQFSGDHKTSQRSLQQMPLKQQCDHIEGESQLAITNCVRSTVIEEVPIAESNLEKKTPTQPKNACCTTHLNGSARCKQPHKSKPCIAVTERDNQRHSSALWHQPKVTRFMELSTVSPSPDPPKQGTCNNKK